MNGKEIRGRTLLSIRPITAQMPRRPVASHREDGFLSVGGIVTVLFTFSVIFAAIKLLPPYIDNYQLQDSLNTIARNATYSKMSESDVRTVVLREAHDVGVELDPSQVVVQRTGPSINISVAYYVTVDLLVRQLDLEFTPSAGNRIITAR